LHPDRGWGSAGEKRQEIALRMLRRGYHPDIASELTQEGLTELERRLDKLELQEEKDTRLSQNNWISWLVSKLGRRKTRHFPLRCDDLPKDQVRVTKLKIETLEKQCRGLAAEFYTIKNQIKIVMSYSNSGDQLASLEDSKARIEKELRQKQEELTTLKTRSRERQVKQHYNEL